MKLSKAIIKKYGITKKAWQVQRGKLKGRIATTSKKTKRKVYTMARRRTRGFKRGNSKPSFQRIAMGGAIYGAVGRPLISKVADMIGRPLGNYTDEALGGVAGYFLMKQIRQKY